MKKLVFGILVMVMTGAIGYSEVRFDTLTWFDYETVILSNGNTTGGAFNISRLYFGLRGDIGKDWFGNKIKGRVTLDLSKSQFDSTTNTTKSIPIKYAYIDYVVKLQNEVLTNKVDFAEIALSAGLIKSFFGNIADWEYPMPIKDATEIYNAVKPSASADFGFSIGGKLFMSADNANGLVKFNVQLLNGEGYEKLMSATKSGQNNFAFQANVGVMPMKGVTIGGTYRYEDYNTSLKRVSAYNALLSAKNISLGEGTLPVDILLQYIGLNTTTVANSAVVSGSVISAMLGYGFFPDEKGEMTLTPYVRYDMCDPTTNTNDETSSLYVSANIKPTKDLSVLPMFGYNLSTGDINLKLELQYKLGFVVAP